MVGGTAKADKIQLKTVSGKVTVYLNSALLGSFSPTGNVIVYGQDGNDTISVDPIGHGVLAYGNAGNDTITVKSDKAILLGGDGNDKLTGGTARDILIGGLGIDVFSGGGDEDILIGGNTTYDNMTEANQKALLLIQKEWIRKDATHAVRISHLTGASRGYNYPFYFTTGATGATVFPKQTGEKVATATGDWAM